MDSPAREVPRLCLFQGQHFSLDHGFPFCYLSLLLNNLFCETLPWVGVPSRMALCPRKALSKFCHVCSSPSVWDPEGSSLLCDRWEKHILHGGKSKHLQLHSVENACSRCIIPVDQMQLQGYWGSHKTRGRCSSGSHFDVRSRVGAMQELEPIPSLNVCKIHSCLRQALVTKKL